MKLNKWLTVSSRGATRITANNPALDANEISMNLIADIPDALFWRPTITATIVVPKDKVPPLEISAEVVEQVGIAIREATGLQVVLSVSTPEDEQ